MQHICMGGQELLLARAHSSTARKSIASMHANARRVHVRRRVRVGTAPVHAPCFVYQYDVEAPFFDGGAAHGAELAFVFGAFDLPKLDQVFGSELIFIDVYVDV